MSIVTLPLPAQIVNGTVGDATQVMAGLNYIAAQVNANAQPMGSTPSLAEWQSLGQTPTYISATSFSVPGDLTTTLQPGRRLQTTNTGGTIYSTIVTSAYTSLTTVTVVNDSGVLDSGLSVVNFGLLSAQNRSIPVPTAIAVHSNSTTNLSTGIPEIIGNTHDVVDYDVLSEWSSGTFTCKQSGTYLFIAQVNINPSGATISEAPFLTFGGTGAPTQVHFIPNANTSVTTAFGSVFSGSLKLTAGQTLTALLQAGFTGGPAHYTFNVTIARVGA
jgi:hypothetical protein